MELAESTSLQCQHVCKHLTVSHTACRVKQACDAMQHCSLSTTLSPTLVHAVRACSECMHACMADNRNRPCSGWSHALTATVTTPCHVIQRHSMCRCRATTHPWSALHPGALDPAKAWLPFTRPTLGAPLVTGGSGCSTCGASSAPGRGFLSQQAPHQASFTNLVSEKCDV